MPDFKQTLEVEAFRSGTWTDSAGNTKAWSDTDLDTIASRYNESIGKGEREAPVVVGHPKDNSPAYGWVESARRAGDRLMLKLKDVQDGFVTALKEGLYKKRSISLFPDMNIRHLGFLGGAQPAVPGLADVQFEAADNSVSFEFALENSDEDIEFIKKENTFFKSLFLRFGMDIAKAQDHTEPSTSTETTEDDMSEELKAQVAELTAKIAEFEKTAGEKDTEITNLKAEIQASTDTARKVEHKAFCDALVGEGKLLPANMEMTLENMELRFQADLAKGEGAESLKSYKESLSGTETVVEMSEVATKTAATTAVASGSDKFTDMCQARANEKKISFAAAMVEIQVEQPALAREYAAS